MKKRKRACGTALAFLTAMLLTALPGCGTEAVFFPAETGDPPGADAEGASREDGADASGPESMPEDTAGSEDGTAGSDDSGQTREICVYICGAVGRPGVYYLPGGSRICDVVEAAGGLAENAETRAVNQAAYLSDGEQIVIPTEEEAGAFFSGNAADTGMPDAAGSDRTGTTAGDPVNINTADASRLMTLPGIGEAKAAAIVAYRERNGPFGAIGDIRKVTGIGDGIYAKIRDRITAE